MNSGTSSFPRAALFAVAVVVAMLLTWRTLFAGFGALLEPSATVNPELARSPLEVSGSDRPWRERLARNPADVGGMLVLALELERANRHDDADAAMRQAMRLAPADRQVLTEAAAFFLRAGDNVQALTVLRRLVDLYPGAGGSVWPVFSALLETRGTTEFFTAAARDNPSWWPGFFQFACDKARDTGGLQQVFAVRAARGLATIDERRCVVARLQREGNWNGAYQVWINSLPEAERQRIAYLYNGGFEQPMSNLGFDWITPDQDGVKTAAEGADGVTGHRALHVVFVQKRYAGPPVYQYTMLAPGSYRLEGRARADELDTWLGLQWGLYCLNVPVPGSDPRQLTRSDPLLGSSDWIAFHHDFVVPRDCPVQVLRLELANPRRDAATPGTSAVRLRGSVWFDDMRIRILE